MEITEEGLKASLNELQELEKSQKANGLDEPLKKSTDTPTETDVGNSGDGQDLNKGGGTHSSDEGHGQMYKMQGHDMQKMQGHEQTTNKTTATTHYDQDPKQMEGESDADYEIRKKNMAMQGHDNSGGEMAKMQYSQAGEENDLLKSFQEDGQLKKAIDVSDFLKSLVEKTTAHLNTVDSRLEKSFSHLLETIETQNRVIINQGQQIEGLQKSFNEVLSQPVGAPRSVGSGVSPVGRGPGDLNKSQNNNPNPQLLRKSILNKMTLAVERGELRDTDLIKFETTGEISNENLNRFGSQG